jgi:adenylate kinase
VGGQPTNVSAMLAASATTSSIVIIISNHEIEKSEAARPQHRP